MTASGLPEAPSAPRLPRSRLRASTAPYHTNTTLICALERVACSLGDVRVLPLARRDSRWRKPCVRSSGELSPGVRERPPIAAYVPFPPPALPGPAANLATIRPAARSRRRAESSRARAAPGGAAARRGRRRDRGRSPLGGVARGEAGLRVSRVDGGAVRRGAAGGVGRGRSCRAGVDDSGGADEGATRAPGAAVRPGGRGAAGGGAASRCRDPARVRRAGLPERPRAGAR